LAVSSTKLYALSARYFVEFILSLLKLSLKSEDRFVTSLLLERFLQLKLQPCDLVGDDHRHLGDEMIALEIKIF
jgi:hypothetical protein